MKTGILLIVGVGLFSIGCESNSPKWVERKSAPQNSSDVPIFLPGKPSLRMNLDREYSGLFVPPIKTNLDCVSYMLAPKDDQSALVISIGEQCHETDTDAELAKDPGFTGTTTGPGVIAGQKVVWKRWSD